MYYLDNVKSLKPFFTGLLLIIFCWTSLESSAQTGCQTQAEIKNALMNCDPQFQNDVHFDPITTLSDPNGTCLEGNIEADVTWCWDLSNVLEWTIVISGLSSVQEYIINGADFLNLSLWTDSNGNLTITSYTYFGAEPALTIENSDDSDCLINFSVNNVIPGENLEDPYITPEMTEIIVETIIQDVDNNLSFYTCSANGSQASFTEKKNHLTTAVISSLSNCNIVSSYGGIFCTSECLPESLIDCVLAGLACPCCPLAEQGITFDIKVLLEGAITASGSMNTNLSTSNLLPLVQPYNASPFSYNGAESLCELAPDIVDWVLVELRSAADFYTVVDKRAVLLRTDGQIVMPDGSQGVTFPNAVDYEEYHIVVRHRNHIKVISACTVMSPDNVVYDFTADPTMTAGSSQVINVNGEFAMIAGDIDASNTINFSDFSQWLSTNNFLNQYIASDLDLNGTVNFLDFILWLSHNNQLGFNYNGSNLPLDNCQLKQTVPCTPEKLSLSEFSSNIVNAYASSDWFSVGNTWSSKRNHYKNTWQLYGGGRMQLNQGVLGLAEQPSIEFTYCARNINANSGWTNQSFELQRSDDGTNFYTIKTWYEGTDFTSSGNSWSSPVVYASMQYQIANDITSPNTTFRIKNNSVNGGSQLFIDNITIMGCDENGGTVRLANEHAVIESAAMISLEIMYDAQKVWFKYSGVDYLEDPLNYSIFNMTGQQVIFDQSEQTLWSLDKSNLPSGAYIINVGNQAETFLIQ